MPRSPWKRRWGVASGGVVAASALLALAGVSSSALVAQTSPMGNLFPQLANVKVGSATASNNDTNPYGVAVVPKTMGNLVAGDVLVADFNSSAGTFGAGTSIVEVNPTTGQSTTFYQNADITGPVGIAINPSNDIVWVGYWGSTANGSGSGYAVINSSGTLIANYTSTNSTFAGVWGAAVAPGAFFWSNVAVSNTGADGQVWRLNPNPTGTSNGQPLNATYTALATGLPTNSNVSGGETASNAGGPQGMVYDPANGMLYVADDVNNTIYAIPNALTATTPQTPMVVSQSPLLQSPQNIAINPQNGDLLVVNGATNNDLLEINPMNGMVVATRVLDTGAAGGLFGLATATNAMGQLQVYYDDSNSSTLNALMAPNTAYGSYAFVRGNGHVSSFGPLGTGQPAAPASGVVGYAPDPAMAGAGWEVTASGMVMSVGGAPSYGSVQTAGVTHLAAPIVGIASTPDGMGYWLVGADGGVFAFGDAHYMGNTYTDGLTGLGGAHPLAAPIVGIASTPDGMGYWLVGADGGVFAFGDAEYMGNTYTDGLTGLGGAHPLAAPIVGIASTPDGMGYWLVGADGGVFAFGDAHYMGNTYTDGLTGLHGAHPLAQPVIGLVPTPDGMGYWLLAADGGVFAFGNAEYMGSGPAFGDTGPFTAGGSISA
ncbi:hypothetical protein Afer_1977 [Acidimicrobium ferrooxidans DSM 10331]|uniref:NHL repeat containing protein n=1 Tax=Acidimicrobium ferrooxidans (strain DSM 10331 / JCM 15462 / NBRC 103882 / ICP) TaxID=525909 RepID=C7M1Y3_ACIFD|nr:hypothetical protein [Acidimicrobium ferrooxidans]ACU54880.1 hypothetical protein Afer_1977 [Acidimicrobium ferrooxidans DSM 10331]